MFRGEDPDVHRKLGDGSYPPNHLKLCRGRGCSAPDANVRVTEFPGVREKDFRCLFVSGDFVLFFP